MKFKFTLLFTLVFSFSQFAQMHTYWQAMNIDNLPQLQTDTHILPQDFQSFSLDFETIKDKLNVIAEGTDVEKAKIIFLPTVHQRMIPFEVEYAPVMESGLANKYPQIKTFSATSFLNPNMKARLEFTLNGFRAVIRNWETREMTIIEPYQKGNLMHYVVYTQDAINREAIIENAIENGWGYQTYHFNDAEMESLNLPVLEHTHKGDTEPHTHSSLKTVAAKAELRTYRLALACTGEFAQQIANGTVASVLSEFTSAVNILNEILINELGVEIVLVDNEEEIIFLDPNDDPFSAPTNTSQLASVNNTLINSVIGTENFDIGHVFTIGCAGGVAGVSLGVGTVCDPMFKAAGVTCHFSSNLTMIVQEIMAHEFGHQLGAEHTWNNCPTADIDQFQFGSAFEPGSGSTIMSYAGTCGNQNIQSNADPYYHIGSIAEIYAYTREGDGNTCPMLTVTNNDEPEAMHNYEDGFWIPINTPFELTGSGSDLNSDNLTYAWEQTNIGPISNIGNAIQNAPLFRSYLPSTSPTRVFPRMLTIVTNGNDNTEALPDTTRNLTFRFTVRDNNEEVGAIAVDTLSFNSTMTAGPFLVTNPDANSPTWEVGQYVEVTWDVANTDNNLVNCQKVNIRLSTDGGFTYPITLLENTPNDGSAFISVPDAVTNNARIRVEAVDNIFFDISNENFFITEPTTQGFGILTNFPCAQTCWPQSLQYTLETSSLMGFSGDITFSTENLPVGAVATFNPETVTSGESTVMTVDFAGVSVEDSYVFNVVGTADGAETQTRFIETDFVYNNFENLVAQTPNAAGEGTLPTFTWDGVPHANSYEIEISTSPLFDNIVCVISDIAAGETSVPSCATLEENTQYFWRIRGINECGAHDFTNIQGFQTLGLSCTTIESSDPSINITDVGTPEITTTITIPQSGIIDDLNLIGLVGQFDAFGDLEFELCSPSGTSVILVTGLTCFSTQPFSFSLDDQASTSDFPCPPTGGINLQPPTNPLSTFNGEDANGTWTLKVRVTDSFGTQGGQFDGWAIEYCGGFGSANPTVELNETMCVNPGTDDPINENFLVITDADNNDSELTYTIVTAPTEGVLLLNGNEIFVGATFTHQDIVNNEVRYSNINEDATNDSFTFTVTDGNGGYIGTSTFAIEILDEPDCISNTEFLNPDTDILLYPNPAKESVFIEFKQILTGKMTTKIIDVQGRIIQEATFENTIDKIELNTSQLASGIYFINFVMKEGAFTKKVTIDAGR